MDIKEHNPDLVLMANNLYRIAEAPDAVFPLKPFSDLSEIMKNKFFRMAEYSLSKIYRGDL